MRLIHGVDLTDTWYRFALGFQVCIQARPPHTASCQAFHPCNALVYAYLTQFLDYSLSSWWSNNHLCIPKYTTIQHTQLLPPLILLHSSLWLLRGGGAVSRAWSPQKFWNFTASQVSSEAISYCSVRRLHSKIATVR